MPTPDASASRNEYLRRQLGTESGPHETVTVAADLKRSAEVFADINACLGRNPSIPDLMVAATAELAGLIVLHFDKDFELISEVTGQQVERLAADDRSP